MRKTYNRTQQIPQPGFSPKPAKRRFEFFADDATPSPSPSPSGTPPPETKSPGGHFRNYQAQISRRRPKAPRKLAKI